MQNTVYRASRLSIIYAAFLLACAVQVWHAPAVQYAAGCCAIKAGSSSVIAPALSGLFAVLQSPLWGYFVLALLGVDGLQELRKRPLCFPIKLAVQKAAAILLSVGVVGVLILGSAYTLDTKFALHSTALSSLYTLVGSRSWGTIGLLMKSAGLLGVVLVLSFGRRPPGR